MSQHIFTTAHKGRPIEIMIGWDRPLQGYFMVIEYTDGADDDDNPYLYSNLNDADLPSSHPKELSEFLARLKSLALAVPQKMLQEVLEDGRANVGNKQVHYN